MFMYKGFTLTETIVVIAITAIVMTSFTAFFVRMWQMNHFTIELGYATLIASRGVDNAVKNIRRASYGGDGSYPVEDLDEDEFIFYANYDDDDDIERVRYFLNDVDNTFNVGVTDIDTSSTPPTYDPATDEVVTQIANYVVNNPSEEPIFRYYDLENNEVTIPANVGDVSLVKILLFVNIDEIKQPNNVRIESHVLMRNLSTFGHTPT